MSNLSLRAMDVSGQKVSEVQNLDPTTSVGDLVQGLVTRMRLPRNDSSGRPLSYQLLLREQGRHLTSDSRIGEFAQESDTVVLQPSVEAGRSAVGSIGRCGSHR